MFSSKTLIYFRLKVERMKERCSFTSLMKDMLFIFVNLRLENKINI